MSVFPDLSQSDFVEVYSSGKGRFDREDIKSVPKRKKKEKKIKKEKKKTIAKLIRELKQKKIKNLTTRQKNELKENLEESEFKDLPQGKNEKFYGTELVKDMWILEYITRSHNSKSNKVDELYEIRLKVQGYLEIIINGDEDKQSEIEKIRPEAQKFYDIAKLL